MDWEAKQALDRALARHIGLSLEDAADFKPTSSWDSLGLLLESPLVLDLAPSIAYDDELGIWNVSVHGAQPGQAQRGELREILSDVIARAFKLETIAK
jgi:hypothetical protein